MTEPMDSGPDILAHLAWLEKEHLAGKPRDAVLRFLGDVMGRAVQEDAVIEFLREKIGANVVLRMMHAVQHASAGRYIGKDARLDLAELLAADWEQANHDTDDLHQGAIDLMAATEAMMAVAIRPTPKKVAACVEWVLNRHDYRIQFADNPDIAAAEGALQAELQRQRDFVFT